MLRRVGLLLLLLLLIPMWGNSWGVWAHRRITRVAVAALPAELRPLYKRNLRYLEEQSLAPDRRRYVDPDEGPRHYLDLEFYQPSLSDTGVLRYSQALERFGRDSLRRHGEVPWQIHRVYLRLVEAYRRREAGQVLKLSAELSHYVADACVPLHSTVHYDGQHSGQRGIHALWEGTLPERYGDSYAYWVQPAQVIEAPLRHAWQLVIESHARVDTVLSLDQRLRASMAGDERRGYARRGGQTTRAPAADRVAQYHALLGGMVEQRMRRAAQAVSDYWLSAWVEAGQPDISRLGTFEMVGAEPSDVAAPACR